jgi:nicotinamide riboside kinase
MLRIALIGSHGVGKTTLARPLAKVLGLPYIEEQARIAIKTLRVKDLDEFRKNKDMFSTFQHDIIRRQINAEARYQATGFVSDRSTCDNLCYYLLNTLDSKEIVEHYKLLALNHYITGYDLVIYIPIVFNLVDDGIRNKDEHYRYEVDKLIRKYMCLNDNLYELKALTVEERIIEVVGLVENKFTSHYAEEEIINDTKRID